MVPLKVFLILVDAIGMYLTARPPNPLDASSKPLIPDWREQYLCFLAIPCVFFRWITWIAEFVEILILVSTTLPCSDTCNTIVHMLMYTSNGATTLRITTAFVFGNILIVTGTLLRLQCYRTLGKFFTFQLYIFSDHRLVTTGPYAFCRHPSYSAMILTIVGAIFTNGGYGSWTTESGILCFTFAKLLVGYWLGVGIAVIASLLLRIEREDTILIERFGDEWVEWARDVPYKIVPGVY